MIAYEEVMNDEIKQEEIVFEGFTPPTEDYFDTLYYWRMIGARIDSLAEYKIVDYILQMTWGSGDPYIFMPLTIESLMYGFINEYGEQVDNGTGLSRQSVVTGLDKAIRHGLIERRIEYWKDEEGRTRTTRYYGLKFYEPVEVKNLDFDYFPEESAVNNLDSEPDQTPQVKNLDFDDNQPVEPFLPESLNGVPLSNNSNNIPIDSNSNIIRITERQQFRKSGNKEEYPAFIRSSAKELSIDLGDPEHIAPNIAQITRLYRQFSNNDPNSFQQRIDEAKGQALKASIKKLNSRGYPNRMPYFFSCLKKLFDC